MSSISGIGFGGLASGLDTRSLIRQLIAVERRPLELLQLRDQKLGSQATLFGELRGKLEALQAAAAGLRTVDAFRGIKATVEPPGFLTASAQAGAKAGSWQVSVDALARAQSSASLGKADKDVTLYGAGTLQITIDGQQHDIGIGPGSDTLEGIAQAINDADVGVTATVVDTGQAPGRYKLVVTGDQTGSAQAFGIGASVGSSANLLALANEIDGNPVQAAVDASLTVNGVPIVRSSNRITDAVPGVTLDLLAVHQSGSSTVTVGSDSSDVTARVQKLVDAYNDLVAWFEKQGQVDDKGKAQSPLFGDAALRSIRAGLRQILGGSVDTGNAAYSLLSQVGIEADTQGRLSLDAAKFATAMTAAPDAVTALFAKADSGIADALHGRLQGYTSSVDGLVKGRSDGIEERKRHLRTQIEGQESRLQALEKQLTDRFARLEELLARLQAQGQALGLA